MQRHRTESHANDLHGRVEQRQSIAGRWFAVESFSTEERRQCTVGKGDAEERNCRDMAERSEAK